MSDKDINSLPSSYSISRAFSLFSLAVLVGALLASYNCHLVFVLLVALLPLLLRPLCLWPLRVAVILSLALTFSFFWTEVRKANSGPSSNDLCFLDTRYLGRRVHIVGQIEEVRERASTLESGAKHDFTLIVRADKLLYPTEQELDGRVLVNIEEVEVADSFVAPLPGDLVEIAGVLRKPRSKTFSFEFDEAAWLASKGIFARLSVKADDFHISKVQDQLVGLGRTIAVLRKEIIAAHCKNLGAVSGSLFSSMVLGDRVVSVDPDLKRQFSLVGLSHLLAASGLNLTIIVSAALLLCRFFQNKPKLGQNSVSNKRVSWFETYIPFLCVLLFTAFAGAGPSVSRAAIMCLVALWARLAFVRLAHGAALALALLFALALDPMSVSDVGLQLSYGATFGIIYIYPLIELAWLKTIKTSWLKALCSLVAVVVAAQIAVLPIQLQIFQQLSILVIPANLLAEPVVVPITIMGFISSILAALASCPLPPALQFCRPLLDCAGALSSGIDCLAKYPLDWLTYLAGFLAHIPFVSLSVAKPQLVYIGIYYSVLALALVWGHLRPRLSLFVLSLAFLFLSTLSYIESPLLQLLCTSRELIVNRGNFEYFVLPFCRLTETGQDHLDRPQTAVGQSFVRHMTARGIPAVKAPFMGDQLILSEEALKIQIASASRRASCPPSLELVSWPKKKQSAVDVPRLLLLPSSREPIFCRVSGEVASPRFIPHCRRVMPFSFPLLTEVEAVKSAYLVTLRL